ncbi:enamine deaminase RidA (YjgF/YER057c/UK114 family) [Kribbella amoyensis]|uniref:Enamine deaminase RidA (YjgF/YER057c/UK114 family) n=1 Tax=Kribbella amoyensis TaxID=996641 RepID=A0A561BTR0_9ACTN|nr:Rid family hydrolase [Kribbella amoyensis]TWD82192.1 enamine deaminase RidA (YjgF/YER057c/UK114 family) [Kribbella amoyensis]
MSTVTFGVVPGYGEKLHAALGYSGAVRVDDRVEISGQAGVDDDLVIPDALEDEIVRAFDNVERALATVGATWKDVIHVNSYHKVAPGEDVIGDDHNKVMAEQFRLRMGGRAPIWTETGVTVLGLATMRIEIRVTAIVGSGS